MTPATQRYPIWRRLLIAPPIVVGVAVMAVVILSNDGPRREAGAETARPVRVIAAPMVDAAPRALGFGVAQPDRTWHAVAQVGGRITFLHQDAARGAVIHAGTEVLRIDSTDYDLQAAQIEANILAVDAETNQLDQQIENLGASLDIEQRVLDLGEQELARYRQLLSRDSIAQSAVDAQERAVLQQQQRVQEISNEISLAPSRRAVLEANMAALLAQLSTAQTNIDRSRVIAPYTVRIGELRIEESQNVNVGETLLTADGVERVEITARIPAGKLFALLPPGFQPPSIESEAVNRVAADIGVAAQVRLRSGRMDAVWPARVARIEEMVDPRTRTIGVVVVVDRPYELIAPGVRPPLLRNMYVEVVLTGQSRPNVVVAPMEALHGPMTPDGAGESVYVADADNRLRIRPVTLAARQTDYAIIDEGLAAGDLVVVSDLFPAIEGMLLDPQPDAGFEAALIARATGASPAR